LSDAPPLIHKRKTDKTPRFYCLDGLRGLAAVVVMLYHYTLHAGGVRLLGGAYVVVDLFFILSGFVLIHSYGKKIENGMNLKRFMLIRVVRLYPLYLLGLILGFIALIHYSVLADTLDVDASKINHALLLNTLMLPYLNYEVWYFDKDILTGIIYPLNDPGWTIFFEFFVNIIFFYWISKFKNIKIIYLFAITYLIFFLYVVLTRTANPGWGVYNFYGGFPRVISEFFMGILVYQHYEKIKAKPWLTVAIAGAVFGLMSIGNTKLSLINMFILCPLLVLLCAKIQFKTIGNKVCTYLGNLSFPLYIVHVPIYHFMLNFEPISTLPIANKVIAISLTAIVISTLLIKGDKVVRNRLNLLFGLRKIGPKL